MSLPQRADLRRRRLARVRILAALGMISSSFLLGVGAASGQGDPASEAPAPDGPVREAPADACNGVLTSVTVIGSSSAKEAFGNWAPEICDRLDIVADYTDFGSKGGREAVTPADAAVIGLTSLPFDEEEVKALEAERRGIVLVPTVATSVACTYWDTNPADPKLSGTRFPNLRISRRTLADLSGGSPRDGTNFSPDLAADNADNPDFKVGAPFLNIEVWFRSGYSAVAHQLTDWFAQDEQAETDFLKGAFLGYELPFEDIGTPDGSAPSLINDYTTMKSRMLGALQNLGIGCMDNATARTDAKPETEAIEALNVALLDNAAGEFVAPTTEAVTAAIEGMKANADGTFTPDWELDDPEAYPLPLVVYAAMPTCGIDADTRADMDAVMTYAIGEGQKDLPAGNVAMPKNVADVAARQLGSWRTLTAKVGPCTPVPTTTTTTAPTTTTPGPTTTVDTTIPFESTFVPPSDPGGGGVFTDPNLATGGGTTGADLGGGGDEGAAPAGDGGGTAGDPVPEVAAPTGPLSSIVAVATGSQAVPPMALFAGGASLLVAGPMLQVLGGTKKAGSLPSSVLAWFARLKP